MKKKSIKILDKKFDKPVSCLAVYSPTVAKILDGLVDMILVGDSLGTTLYGMKNTQNVTLKMMENHGEAVIKNISKSISIIDMPFGSYENNKEALKNANNLIKKTKANFIKIEILKDNHISIINYLSKKKLNVIAHIGVTPQSFNDFRKIKVVGRSKLEIDKLVKLAIATENAGAKIILIECVTEKAAKRVTNSISVPIIGIGASKYCDGQVLVFDDLINLSVNSHRPKFVKNYMDFKKLTLKSVNAFVSDIKNKKFPTRRYSYK